MVPDTCLRLRTVLKALDDIVTPALPPQAGFAHEQLALIKKSVQLVIDQVPHEYAFMVRDARDHLALTQGILALLGPEDAAYNRLAESSRRIAAGLPAHLPDVPELERDLRRLKQDVEDAVDGLCGERAGASLAAVEQMVLDHSARRIQMERAWTIATGFEIERGSVPPISDLLYGAGNSDAETHED